MSESEILYDCDTCKIYPCIFIKQNNPKELKGECIGWKCDIDKITKEQFKIFTKLNQNQNV